MKYKVKLEIKASIVETEFEDVYDLAKFLEDWAEHGVNSFEITSKDIKEKK